MTTNLSHTRVILIHVSLSPFWLVIFLVVPWKWIWAVFQHKVGQCRSTKIDMTTFSNASNTTNLDKLELIQRNRAIAFLVTTLWQFILHQSHKLKQTLDHGFWCWRRFLTRVHVMVCSHTRRRVRVRIPVPGDIPMATVVQCRKFHTGPKTGTDTRP